MIRWDTPNFFEMTDRKFMIWRDTDNMRDIREYSRIEVLWVLSQSKYVNSGFMFDEIIENFSIL